MATKKRLIDAKDVKELINGLSELPWEEEVDYLVDELPTVDAVEEDIAIEMFEYMLGDCPCNFSPVDEWLAERCELQNECPNPKDKRGCWKQFIKHFVAEMDGERKGND